MMHTTFHHQGIKDSSNDIQLSTTMPSITIQSTSAASWGVSSLNLFTNYPKSVVQHFIHQYHLSSLPKGSTPCRWAMITKTAHIISLFFILANHFSSNKLLLWFHLFLISFWLRLSHLVFYQGLTTIWLNPY